MRHLHRSLPLIVCLLVACVAPQDAPPPAVLGTDTVLLSAQDLQDLGLTGNATSCTTESYETSEYSPLAQHSTCTYSIVGSNASEFVLEVKKFTNLNDLNGAYQYDSSHLFGADGLLSENTYGDQSRFRVNSAGDYGSEFNPPGVFFYHLWFTKGTYLVHITSRGVEGDRAYIAAMGEKILAKFA